MKNKGILSLAVLIGIGIGSIFTSCNNRDNEIRANENDYLKYCGKQTVMRSKIVEIYEDKQHKKVIYVVDDGNRISISAVSY